MSATFEPTGIAGVRKHNIQTELGPQPQILGSIQSAPGHLIRALESLGYPPEFNRRRETVAQEAWASMERLFDLGGYVLSDGKLKLGQVNGSGRFNQELARRGIVNYSNLFQANRGLELGRPYFPEDDEERANKTAAAMVVMGLRRLITVTSHTDRGLPVYEPGIRVPHSRIIGRDEIVGFGYLRAGLEAYVSKLYRGAGVSGETIHPASLVATGLYALAMGIPFQDR